MTITLAETIKFAKALAKHESEASGESWRDGFLSNYVYTPDLTLDQAARQVASMLYRQNDTDQNVIYDFANGAGYNYNPQAAFEFYDVLEKSIGFDGNISEWTADGKNTIYVAFKQNQFKNADNLNPTEDVDVRYSSDIPIYTEKQYNDYGWANHEGLLTARANALWQGQLRNMKQAPKAFDGSRIIAISDEFGIGNTLVYTKGTFENPKITKIVTIAEDENADFAVDTILDYVREGIYESEKWDGNAITRIKDMFPEGYINEHSRFDMPNYRSYADNARKKRQGGGNLRDAGEIFRAGADSDAEGNGEVNSDIRFSRGYNIAGQMSLDDISVSKEEGFRDKLNAFLDELESRTIIYNTDLQKFLIAYPDFDFLNRIASEGEPAIQDLRELLKSFANVKDVQRMAFFYEGSRSQYYSANRGTTDSLKKFKAELRKRVDELLPKVGRNLNIKAGDMNIDDVEKLFNSLNSDNENSVLARKVFETSRKLGVTIEFKANSDFDLLRTGYRGAEVYGEAGGNKVKYTRQYFNSANWSDQDKANTILHEMIHTCTTYAIWMNEHSRASRLDYDQQQSAKLIVELYRQAMRETSLKGEYGIQNEKEFIAELSNPVFRDKLKKISLWDRIINAFCGFFGITRKKNNTKYEAAYNALETLLDSASYSAAYYYNGVFRLQHPRFSDDLSERTFNQTVREMSPKQLIDGLKEFHGTSKYWASRTKTEGITIKRTAFEKSVKRILTAYHSEYGYQRTVDELKKAANAFAQIIYEPDKDYYTPLINKANELAVDIVDYERRSLNVEAQDISDFDTVMEAFTDTYAPYAEGLQAKYDAYYRAHEGAEPALNVYPLHIAFLATMFG